jgi:hypothetical protein
MCTYTVKKRLTIFLSPAGMSLTKLSLAGKLFPPRDLGRVWSLVSDIPAGDGKMANLFLQYTAVLGSWVLLGACMPCIYTVFLRAPIFLGSNTRKQVLRAPTLRSFAALLTYLLNFILRKSRKIHSSEKNPRKYLKVPKCEIFDPFFLHQ